MKIRELLATKDQVTRRDREWLLQDLMRMSHGELVLRVDEEIPSALLRKYKNWLTKRRKGMPLQYITGRAPFRNLVLNVNSKALIPRPETEVLVDLAFKYCEAESAKVLDLGTGSGAIALAIKTERPNWEVYASDISSAALSVAKKNAKEAGCQIYWMQSNVLEKFRDQRFDLIVSNPPYVNPDKDKVAENVHKFEPHLALYPQKKFKVKNIKERGAWIADQIISSVANGNIYCRYLFMELSPRVASVLEKRWKKDPKIERIWREEDLAGRPRFLLIAWKVNG